MAHNWIKEDATHRKCEYCAATQERITVRGLISLKGRRDKDRRERERVLRYVWKLTTGSNPVCPMPSFRDRQQMRKRQNQEPDLTPGFRERQLARLRQKILDASLAMITEGKHPESPQVADLVNCTSVTAEKYQYELIKQGLLTIPEGLERSKTSNRFKMAAPKPICECGKARVAYRGYCRTCYCKKMRTGELVAIAKREPTKEEHETFTQKARRDIARVSKDKAHSI